VISKSAAGWITSSRCNTHRTIISRATANNDHGCIRSTNRAHL